jgi:UDP-glucose 4-epimerase
VTGDPAPEPRRVLVTGASGLVGRRVVEQLAPWATVVAFDLHPPDPEERIAGVEYLAGDIRQEDLDRVLEMRGIDSVVHLAAVVTPGPGSTRDLEYAIDVLGTRNVVAACAAAGVRQLVYTSSGAAYGYHPDAPAQLRESDPLRGNEEFAYAWHKRLAEEELAAARNAHPELGQLIFRVGTILGASVASPISAFFERPVVVGVAGADTPFVFVWDEDVADCIVKGLRERRTGIFNLCGDGAVPLREIAHRLGRPYLPLPAGVFRVGLRLARALGLSQRGPEQVDFLRYRPVLCNEALKREFGARLRFDSSACFDTYRGLRFGSPKGTPEHGVPLHSSPDQERP